jgi:hypothetical protein
MKIISNIKWFIRNLKRSLAYAKLGWTNWDFDALTIEHYILFKLKRVRTCLLNGYCDLTLEDGPKKMQALDLTIKLLEGLKDEGYSKFYDLHEKKWGTLKVTTVPDGKYFRMVFSRDNANTPELRDQERKESLEASSMDFRIEERNRRLVYSIIAKYIRTWWD